MTPLLVNPQCSLIIDLCILINHNQKILAWEAQQSIAPVYLNAWSNPEYKYFLQTNVLSVALVKTLMWVYYLIRFRCIMYIHSHKLQVSSCKKTKIYNHFIVSFITSKWGWSTHSLLEWKLQFYETCQRWKSWIIYKPRGKVYRRPFFLLNT